MLKTGKRIIAIFAAAVMVIASIPLTAFVFAESSGKAVTYDYNDLTAFPMEGTGSISNYIYKREYFSQLGFYDGSFNDENNYDWASALQRLPESKDGRKQGSITAGWFWLKTHEKGTLTPFVAYCVEGGTDFEATFYVNNSATEGKPVWEARYPGKKFEFKLQASSDYFEWKDIYATGDQYGEITAKVKLDDDVNFVRVVFPQDGNSNGINKDGHIFNHMIELRKVTFVKSEMKYLNTYKYTDLNSIPLEKTTSYISDMYYLKYLGAYAASFNEASVDADAAAIARSKNGAVHPGEAYLRANAAGGAPAWLTYTVKPGSAILAEVEISAADKAEWEALPANAGAKFEIKLQTSADGEKWTDLVSSGKASGKLELEGQIPDTDKYVRVLFPQNGNPNGSAAKGKVFAESAKLNQLRCSAGESETVEGYYDYLDLRAIPISGTGGTTSAIQNDYSVRMLGAYAASMSERNEDWAAALTRSANGALRVGWWWIGSKPQDTLEPHIDYYVKGGTLFRATFNIVKKGKEQWEKLSCYEGRKFEFKIQSSTDGLTWTDVASTGDRYGIVSLSVALEENANYVRIVFPQNGKPSEGSAVFNDMAEIYSVMYHSKETGYNYLDLNKLPISGTAGTGNGMYHPAHFAALGACDGAINSENFSAEYAAITRSANGALRAGYEYLLGSEQGTVMPYITYRVKGGSSFTAALNVNNSKDWGKPYWESLECYAGRKFEFKIQTSADGSTWADAVSTGDKSGNVIITAKVPDNAKYVRIVFPQDGNPNGKGQAGKIFNDMAEILSVSFEKPDGSDYTFGNTVDFTRLEQGILSEAIMQKALMTSASLEGLNIARMQSSRSFLGVTYEYLYRYTDLPRLYVLYNVTPGTAFQIAYKYVAKVNNAISKAIGQNFRFKLYVSSDKINWSEAETLVSYEHDKIGNFDVTELQTIECIGDGIKYVKIEFPQNGNMSKITNGATPYVGNDFIGLERVSFTKGSDDPSNVESLSFDNKYNLAEKGITIKDFEANALEFNAKNGLLMSSWNHFKDCTLGQANPFIIIPVKAGTPFFVEGVMRENVYKAWGEGGFEFKMLVSSDKKNWTDVTYQYRTRVRIDRAGFPICDRFFMDKVPDNVKYVKILYPQTRDYTNFVTPNGTKLLYVGNDFCALTKIYYNAGAVVQPKYDQYLDYYSIYQEYKAGMPEQLSSKNQKILGISNFTDSAFQYSTGGLGLIVREKYVFGQQKVEKPTLIYNVKPGSAFEASVLVKEPDAFVYGSNYKVRIYTSSNGTNWRLADSEEYGYIISGSYIYNLFYKLSNVGSKTNWVKVEFPQYCDGSYIVGDKAKNVSQLFILQHIKASIVNYEAKFEEETKSDGMAIFIEPNTDEKNYYRTYRKQTIVEKIPFTTLEIVLMCVGAAAVLAGGAVTAVIIVKKRKKKGNAAE